MSSGEEITNCSRVFHRLIDELDRFQQEYESFRDIPMVRDFLAAELAYCRTLQEILATIGDELMVNFE